MNKSIKNQFIKVKLCNFKQLTFELSTKEINFDLFITMFTKAYARVNMPIRLLGLGIHFQEKETIQFYQQSLL